MSIETKHFYWLPTPTAWQDAEKWRARRQALTQQFLEANDFMNANFANAATDQIAGAAKLAAQAAVNRINSAAKSTFNQVASLKIDKLA